MKPTTLKGGYKKVICKTVESKCCRCLMLHLYLEKNVTFRKCCSQKQSSRGFLEKRCSENMQQIYRRKRTGEHPRRSSISCNFNKVANQLYWNHTSAYVFSCKFATYFQSTFSYEHLLGAASVFSLRISLFQMLQKKLRKTKSLNKNNQKFKKKQVQTNKWTLIF